FDPEHKTGALMEKKYKPGEAEQVLTLLHYLGDIEQKDPPTWDHLIQSLLHANRLSIRQLAHWHLVSLVPQGANIQYDPGPPTHIRKKAVNEWKQLIPDGKLPPQAPRRSTPGGG